MQDWARTFPRPRHSRVMKPRSAGNSPSTMTRRRTSAAQGVMHGSSNQYQNSLEAALLASAVRNPRPISWHPSSARSRGLSNPACVPEFSPEQYAAMGTMHDQTLNMNALSVYGSDSMLSYPLSAGAAVSPDSYIPFYLDSQDPMSLPQQTPTLSIPNSQVEPMAWDTTNQVDMSAISSDGWSLDMLSMANIPPPVTTCPSYASEKKDSKPEEELVGMGLYSQPDGTCSQSHQQGLLGKGLKLEETFSPSDDEKDEGSQDDNDDTNEPEPVPQQTLPQQHASMSHQSNFSMPQHVKPALNLLHKSFFFDHDDLDQQAMPSAQPFPGLNQSCMSYGYGWI
ncbi:hypothetical protein N7478_004917 [Penicillium angulare]|uniref:uncharacterized protein n=1 Tax=Penicillium angulare TaxID=116970 RepID=UPI002541174B|nr:uncharacterized protein N7478_004917 [Penicillium angulare]KAJ5279545.1 hypothetical protein N7478_004917 [Penicillium angulare]